jgi:nicotinamidase-related amidase
MRRALVVVDVQVDFCPGGALAVRYGDQVVPRLNSLIRTFEETGLPVFFTRDWHPPDHVSFRSEGGPWPPHCVQGSPGAKFHQELDVPRDAEIISKGDRPSEEAYSGFQGTDLGARLKRLEVDDLFIGGLATDYCVKETTLDALRAGFTVEVLKDCVRPVDAKPGDGARALAEMQKAGARLTTSTKAANQMAGTRY